MVKDCRLDHRENIFIIRLASSAAITKAKRIFFCSKIMGRIIKYLSDLPEEHNSLEFNRGPQHIHFYITDGDFISESCSLDIQSVKQLIIDLQNLIDNG